MPKRRIADRVLEAADRLCVGLNELDLSSVTPWIYNPLEYARGSYEQYIRRFADHRVDTFFLGMNPGPWGMTQTGIPFGEVSIVRDWLGVPVVIDPPARQHPARPIQGLNCRRSEISGQRLWGLFRDRFGQPAAFFAEHFVGNFCPLVFMDEGGRNLTPDKFPRPVRSQIETVCDEHLREVLAAMECRTVVGIGGYAAKAAHRAVGHLATPPRITQILHPSPASPAANRDWAGRATQALVESGVWPDS